jgi:hypothetical protein
MENNINLNAFVHSTIERFSDYLAKDLSALSEESAAREAHDGFRPAIKIVAHCGMMYRGVTALLQTGSMPAVSDEQRAAFLASITSREQALEVFQGATKELLEVVDAFPAERWGEPVEGFFGPTMLAAATLASLHTMYHDGQLNHMHIMHGDKDMHWFG